MKFVISGKNIEITDNLRDTIEEKLGKLDRYFASDTTVNVTLSVEKERQKIEVTIPVKGSIIRSEQVSNDMYVSIDLVEEVIERQLKRYKSKIIDRHQSGGGFQQLPIPVAAHPGSGIRRRQQRVRSRRQGDILPRRLRHDSGKAQIGQCGKNQGIHRVQRRLGKG